MVSFEHQFNPIKTKYSWFLTEKGTKKKNEEKPCLVSLIAEKNVEQIVAKPNQPKSV